MPDERGLHQDGRLNGLFPVRGHVGENISGERSLKNKMGDDESLSSTFHSLNS